MNPPGHNPLPTKRQLRSSAKTEDDDDVIQIETEKKPSAQAINTKRGKKKKQAIEEEIPPKPKIKAWARDETPSINSKFEAPIYRLKATVDEKYTFEQAPNAINSYYVQLEARQYQQQLCTYAKGGRLYLPIAFLRALANNDVHWGRFLKLKENGDPAKVEDLLPEVVRKPRAKKNAKKAGSVPPAGVVAPPPARDDRSFINNWKEHWRKATERVLSNARCWIPFRDEQGKLVLLTGDSTNFKTIKLANTSKVKWYNVLDQVWKKKTAASSGQPPRHMDIDIKDGDIKIERTADGIARLDETFWIDAITTLNDQKTKSKLKPDETQTQWRLELVPIFGSIPDTYCMISECPFGLYRTHIPRTDWDRYMKTLGADHEDNESPIRTIDDAAVEEDGAVAAVQEKITDYQKLLNSWKFEVMFKNLIEGNQRATPEQWVTAWRNAMTAPHAQVASSMSDVRTGFYKKTEYGWTLENELKTSRVQRVSGTRKTEPDQNETMGASASQVARELGWLWSTCTNKKRENENQLSNGLYMAEWLHLSAYSWGGYIYAQERQGATSQTPDNLILGTSETNSFMLRYEKAWQNLFQFETELYDQYFGKGTQAMGPMIIDVNKAGTFGDIEVDCQTQDNKYTWAKLKDLDPTGTERKRLQDLAMKYSFLAYSIDYRIGLKTRSFALNKPNPSLQIVFFPLRRQFFHRAESKLDDIIFKKLKTLAREEIGTVIKQAPFKFGNTFNFPCEPLKIPAAPKDMAVEADNDGHALIVVPGADDEKTIDREEEDGEMIVTGPSLHTLDGLPSLVKRPSEIEEEEDTQTKDIPGSFSVDDASDDSKLEEEQKSTDSSYHRNAVDELLGLQKHNSGRGRSFTPGRTEMIRTVFQNNIEFLSEERKRLEALQIGEHDRHLSGIQKNGGVVVDKKKLKPGAKRELLLAEVRGQKNQKNQKKKPAAHAAEDRKVEKIKADGKKTTKKFKTEA